MCSLIVFRRFSQAEVSHGYFSEKRDVESPEDDVEAEVDEDDDVEVGPEDGSDEEVEQEDDHHTDQHRVQSPGKYLHNYHVRDRAANIYSI